MDTSKELTIIIPFLNKAKFIHETIESIDSDSFKSIEILIVDNGSDQNQYQIIKEIENDYSHVSVLDSPIRLNASAARNHGLLNSKGKYILFLDSDDCINASGIQRRLNIMNEDENLDFSIFPMGTFRRTIGDSEMVWNDFSGDHLKRFVKHDLPWAICSTIWRKKVLKSLNGFNEQFPRLQDVELHTRALLFPGIKYEVFPDFEPDCFYRVDDNRIVTDYDVFMKKRMNGALCYINCFIEIAPMDKVKFLKGTYFNFLSQLAVAFRDDQINKVQYNSLKLEFTKSSCDKLLQIKDKLIMSLYFRLVDRKIYFRGLNNLTEKLLLL